jgi:Ca-activated chloride channel family protein
MMKRVLIMTTALVAAYFIWGTWRNANFWLTADQRGDRLSRSGKYAEAANAYADPQRIGVAQYRNGDFEAAAKTFARVAGASGAFNQGNALLMHGQYEKAIASYDRALGFRASWQQAMDNKSIAVARQAKLEASGEDRAEEQVDAYDPDEIKFDQKGEDQRGSPIELAGQSLSNEELRATWLRQVQTTPGDFLRAKFAYQAAHAEPATENAR